MNAIKGRIKYPADTLNGMVNHLLTELGSRNKRQIVLGVTGGADSALALQIAYTASASRENMRVLCINMEYNEVTKDETDRVNSLEKAFGSDKVVFKRLKIQPIISSLFELVGIDRPPTLTNIDSIINTILTIETNQLNGLLLDTTNLTDWFLGLREPAPCGSYQVFKYLLKTEVYKLLSVTIDFLKDSSKSAGQNQKALEQSNALLDCLKAEPIGSDGVPDSHLFDGKSYPEVDHTLCTLLAASETRCELLINSYKDTRIAALLKEAKVMRLNNPLDYNALRVSFLEDA